MLFSKHGLDARCAGRLWVAVLALAFGFGAFAAPAGDPLSGHYRPKDALEDANGDLRVEADGDGWQAWFRNAPGRLDAVAPEKVAEVFPQAPADALPQCAASDTLLLCKLAPGTSVPAGTGGESSTGYMATIAGVGSFELVKLP